jgi:hypothetical protein
MENGRNERRERALLEMFPPGHHTQYIEDPCVIMDPQNRLIAWYIPDALTNDIQVRQQEHLLSNIS